MKMVQSSLLLFLENEDNAEENFHNFVKLIDDEKIQGNEYEFNTLLQKIHLFDMISKLKIYSIRFTTCSLVIFSLKLENKCMYILLNVRYY